LTTLPAATFTLATPPVYFLHAGFLFFLFLFLFLAKIKNEREQGLITHAFFLKNSGDFTTLIATFSVATPLTSFSHAGVFLFLFFFFFNPDNFNGSDVDLGRHSCTKLN
jgi:hypothetical protein